MVILSIVCKQGPSTSWVKEFPSFYRSLKLFHSRKESGTACLSVCFSISSSYQPQPCQGLAVTRQPGDFIWLCSCPWWPGVFSSLFSLLERRSSKKPHLLEPLKVFLDQCWYLGHLTLWEHGKTHEPFSQKFVHNFQWLMEAPPHPQVKNSWSGMVLIAFWTGCRMNQYVT